MSGPTRVNFLLVVTLIGMALAVHLDLRHIDAMAPPLTRLDPTRIRHIRITDHRGRDIRLERPADHWRMTHPYAVQADEARIETLIGIASTPVRRHFSAAQHPLRTFGLDPIRLRLRLDDLEFTFGTTDPIHFRRYLQHNGDILLIDDGFQHHLTAPPEAFVNPSPLPPQARIVRAQIDGAPLAPETVARWGATPAARGGASSLGWHGGPLMGRAGSRTGTVGVSDLGTGPAVAQARSRVGLPVRYLARPKPEIRIDRPRSCGR